MLNGHYILPFSKSVITLLCLKVKPDNISGTTTSSFTYDNFSLIAEHDLPNCLFYVPLSTTWPRYITTVSFCNLSINSIFKHTQNVFQANCFTGVCLYSKLREQNKSQAIPKLDFDTEKCSVLLGRREHTWSVSRGQKRQMQLSEIH